MDKELAVESLTLEQLRQSLTGQKVNGIPVDAARPVRKREPVRGQELAKHRVRVSFDFDVVCNDGPIRNSGFANNIPDDLALLKSFLTADKERLLLKLVEAIASKLAFNSAESFTEAFLPQAKYIDSRELFNAAIDALDGDFGRYWREVQQEEGTKWGDMLSLATEEIHECFSAQFVSSDYEVVEEERQA